ncbi:MAG: hypothetical protein K2G64_05335, partial [Muribaculaceae bacterium]|nr:hypothetical protein [Muribaculaceae bacterium]
VVFLLGFLANRLNKKSEEESVNHHYDEVAADMYNTQNKEEMKQENDTPKPDTQGLMFKTLSQLGCQPTKHDDGTLSVKYQGENFHMEFGGMYARVWDPMWAGIKADDPDVPKIKEAVNATNFNFGPTVVFSAPDDEGIIGFHSRRDIMLHPACPDNVPFVKEVLDSFFNVKEQVRSNFQQINAKQMERQKNRSPIGFTTNTNTTEK